jgi:aspartate racemase
MRVVCVEQANSTHAVELHSESWPPFTGSTDHIACVMHTSGTAAQPRAVGVLHRGISHLMRGMEFLDIRTDDVFVQLAPLSFDASTFEIWQPLASGACLVIPPSRQLSLEQIARLLDKHRVTTLWLTAGLFSLLVEHHPAPLRRLRRLLAGGDVVSPRAVRELLAGGPAVRFVNGYGPTENTTFSCCHALSPREADGRAVPIGRPLTGTEAYVLDSHLNAVPDGATGELYLGGAGLTRGYLGQPSLSAERFLPHPFSDQPGARLYRSGDLVRRRSGGVLEFLGRRDRQLKIRGIRCEPEEIEAIIREQPGVRDVVVAALGAEAADKKLVAYVASDLQDAASQIRNHCSGRLPAALVPSAIILLNRLPLTIEGKVDVRKLPPTIAPAAARQVPPRTESERALLEIWSEVLNVPPPGIHDNFFEIGGDSLTAMQVVSRVWARFKIEFPLSSFFRAPTVAQLALAITEATVRQTDPAVLLATLANVERLSDEDVRSQMKQPHGTRDE